MLEEMFFAPQCEIMLGDLLCSRWHMREMLKQAGMLADGPPLQPHASDYTMLEVCRRFDECDCIDGRDRIFALRQMSREGPQINVDYSWCVRDTYLQVLRDTILSLDESQHL